MISRFVRLVVLLLPFFCFASLLTAQEGASWLRNRRAHALNPKISAIGDFVYRAGPDQANKFSFRETEISLQADVDPNTRADFYFALHEGESFELEEAFITVLSMPFGLQGRGGKFLANFGRLNLVHTHELPQVDRPLVLDSYLGDEGLNDTGIEISRLFTPFNTFTEVTYAFINGLGEEHDDEPVVTTEVMDTSGNLVRVPVHVEEDDDTARTIRNFAHVARMRFFRDLSDAANVEFGVSGALHQPRNAERRKMGGADLTVRWRPVREGLYKSVVWRTEALVSHRKLMEDVNPVTGAIDAAARTVEAAGGYSYLEVQPSRRWRFGVRGDYLEDPEIEALPVTRAVSPYLTYYSSEFNRYRAQYQYKHNSTGPRDHVAWLQWTVVLGPHGGHAY